MSEVNLQANNNQTTNLSMHLPNEQSAKMSLKCHIQEYIDELKRDQVNHQQKIDVLERRLRLIGSHGLSLQRIDNLQTIFLHYCSHIFKTGKHMTFQRLDYQKSHLTMDRFFVFLKDFGLTSALIDGVSKEIIQKSDLILLFKRISLNCKDLNFQHFLSCLQKIGIIYYDEMINYHNKQRKIAQQRKRRKEYYIKSMQRRKAALQAYRNQLNKQDEQNDKMTENQVEDNQVEDNQPQVQIQNENDGLITELLNDKNIENPQQLLEAQLQHLEKGLGQQNQENELQKNANLKGKLENKQLLLVLTSEEKIEYFYQLINVDSSTSFKKKMRELNLPLFQTKHKRNMSQLQRKTESHQQLSNVHKNNDDLDQQKRIQFLKSKIEQRKQRDKLNSPHITKQQYSQRRRKRLKDQQQNAAIVKKPPKIKKIEVSDLQIDLSSLNKIPYENINFHKFNPQKLMQPSSQDDSYLQQYMSAKIKQKAQQSQKRILSTYQSNDGRSQLMLQKLKKRAQQIQIRQKNQQSKMMSSDPHASTEHLIRKNRLVEKLLKLQKQ